MKISTYFLVFTVIPLAVGFTACAPQQGSSPSAPPPKSPTFDGTVSGGGGNGCDGKVFEEYAEKITSLPEYRLFINPILRRMTERGNDVLASYLKWVAEEKSWLFVPCELKRLSVEQIGVSIESDQLARHRMNNIFIYSVKDNIEVKSYFREPLKVKAKLLLHEMVMGARLLMKQSAKEQCQALARRDSRLCSNPDFVQTLQQAAETITPISKDSLVINAEEHDQIWAMTAALAEPKADLGATSVQSLRRRLGFESPFDVLVPRASIGSLVKAVTRTRLLDDKLIVQSGSTIFAGRYARCGVSVDNHGLLYFGATFLSNVPARDAKAAADFLKPFGETALANPRGICEGVLSQGPYGATTNCEAPVLKWPYDLDGSTPNRDAFDVRTVFKNGNPMDEVSVYSERPSQGFFDQRVDRLVARYVLTRDEQPRLHSVTFEAKQALEKGRNGVPLKGTEWLSIPTAAPVTCLNQSLP